MLKEHLFYQPEPPTSRDHRVKLMDIGLTVADLAKELHEQFPNAQEKSIRTMVDNMVYCRDYYPRYATYLNSKYGFRFSIPAHKRPARELLRQAA